MRQEGFGDIVIRTLMLPISIICLLILGNQSALGQVNDLPATPSNSPHPLGPIAASYSIEMVPIASGQSQMKMRLVVPASVQEVELISSSSADQPLRIMVQHTSGQSDPNETTSVNSLQTSAPKTSNSDATATLPSGHVVNNAHASSPLLRPVPPGPLLVTNPYCQDEASTENPLLRRSGMLTPIIGPQVPADQTPQEPKTQYHSTVFGKIEDSNLREQQGPKNESRRENQGLQESDEPAQRKSFFRSIPKLFPKNSERQRPTQQGEAPSDLPPLNATSTKTTIGTGTSFHLGDTNN